METNMPKRAHGTGTVIPYKDGFQLKWSDPDGGRGSKVIRPANRKQAEAALRAVLADLDKGVFHDDRKGNVRFDEFVVQWMSWKEPQVKPGTYVNYKSLVKTLLPTFGTKRLNQITVRHVDIWWSQHHAHPVNRRNAYFVLRGIFKAAVKWNLVAHSPCQVEGAGADVSKLRPDWTVEDFDAVMTHVDTFYRPALNVLFAGHYRLGELIALNGSDVRPGGIVTSTRQKTREGITTDTKTGQHKSIQLLERGRDALASMPRVIGDAPLFPGERTHRMPRLSLQNAWKRACESAGYENFHLHDVRHVSLSLVADVTRSEKITQQRAGHGSATSTRRYLHTDTRMHAEAVSAIDEQVEKRRTA